MELLVLGLVATVGFASYALWSKAQDEEDASGAKRRGPTDRTMATLQVGDVVQHFGTDWLVEGVLTLSDDGRLTHLVRLTDGRAERFLHAKAGEAEPSLLEARPSLTVEGTPESLLHEGRIYRLHSRILAGVERAGSAFESRAGAQVGVAEYSAGIGRVLVLLWGESGDALVGEQVSANQLELLPGR